MDVDVEVRDPAADPIAAAVTVRGGGASTRHEVTLRRADLERLGGPGEDPASFLRRCFEFLLAREPRESILSRFDVAVIARYFPEFEREIAG